MTKSDICHRLKGVTITANSNCIYWVKPNTVHIWGLIKTYQEWVYENQIIYLLACTFFQHVQPCSTFPEDTGKISLMSVSGIGKSCSISLHLVISTSSCLLPFQVLLTLENSKKSTNRPFGLILEHGKKWRKQISSVTITSLPSSQLGTCQNTSHAYYCCYDKVMHITVAMIIYQYTDNDNN